MPCRMNTCRLQEFGATHGIALCKYLNPKSMSNFSPKPIITAIKAII